MTSGNRERDHLDDESLALFVAGELDKARDDVVRAHVASCAVCAERLTAAATLEHDLWRLRQSSSADELGNAPVVPLPSTSAAISRLAPPRVPPPSRVNGTSATSTSALTSTSTPPSPYRTQPAIVAAAVGVGVVIGAVLVAVTLGAVNTRREQALAAIERARIEAEQERASADALHDMAEALRKRDLDATSPYGAVPLAAPTRMTFPLAEEHIEIEATQFDDGAEHALLSLVVRAGASARTTSRSCAVAKLVRVEVGDIEILPLRDTCASPGDPLEAELRYRLRREGDVVIRFAQHRAVLPRLPLLETREFDVQLGTQPFAQAVIDGKKYGSTPFYGARKLRLTRGAHSLDFSDKSTGRTYHYTLEVRGADPENKAVIVLGSEGETHVIGKLRVTRMTTSPLKSRLPTERDEHPNIID